MKHEYALAYMSFTVVASCLSVCLSVSEVREIASIERQSKRDIIELSTCRHDTCL